MAETVFHQRTDFDLLRIDVTDDPRIIEAGFQKLRPSMFDRRNYGTHDERQDAELFFEAYSRLSKPEKRDRVIDEIFQAASGQIDVTLHLLKKGDGPCPPPVYAKLLGILTGQFHFEKGLADRRLAKLLADRELKKWPTLDMAEVQLVEELKATPRLDGVDIAWNLPPAGCEGIVLVRTQAGRPKSHEEGNELIKGNNLTHWLDKTAVPGRWYHYAVFSVFAGVPSAQCQDCRGYRFPDGVDRLKSEPAATSVKLTWLAQDCKQVIVYRSAAPRREIPVAGDRLAPPPECTWKTTTSESSFSDDKQIEAGAVYYYYVVAEYADNIFGEPAVCQVTIPAPLSAPVPGEVIALPGRIVLHWAPGAVLPQGYRLYRLTSQGLPDFKLLTPIYDGHDTRYEDSGVEVGQCYWYYVIALDHGVASSPTRLGPAVAIGEVQQLRPEPRERGVSLTWRRPGGAVRVIVRRGEGTAPASCTDGTAVTVTRPDMAVDGDLVEGRAYAYRVACVFRDPNGRELITAGVTTVPCRPFRMPPPLQSVTPFFTGAVLKLTWSPAEANVAVFCSSEDLPGESGRTLPLAELTARARSVPVKGAAAVDNVDPRCPWYLVANVVEAAQAVVVQKRIYLARLAVRAMRQDGDVVVVWDWPAGFNQVRLVRQAFRANGTEDTRQRKELIVGRHEGADQGQWLDRIGDSDSAPVRAYSALPAAPAHDPALVVLDAGAPAVTVHVGPVAILRYQILQSRGMFGRSGARRLLLQLDREVADFPGVKLVAQPPGAARDEGDVVLTWPECPQTVGPMKIELDLPPGKWREPRFARLFVAKGGVPGSVEILHPPGRENVQL